MFKSFLRKTVKTVSVALVGIAITVCAAGVSEAAAGASEAATTSKAIRSGIVEKWVFIRNYGGGAPAEEQFYCDMGGQAYIDEGLASQYNCELKGSVFALYILTLAG